MTVETRSLSWFISNRDKLLIPDPEEVKQTERLNRLKQQEQSRKDRLYKEEEHRHQRRRESKISNLTHSLDHLGVVLNRLTKEYKQAELSEDDRLIFRSFLTDMTKRVDFVRMVLTQKKRNREDHS